jgi:subtilisin-like proprotein convertase family protein
MTRRRRLGLGAFFAIVSLLSAAAIGGADKGHQPGLNDPRSGAALNREAARNAQPSPVTSPTPRRINSVAVNNPGADSTAQDTQSETSVAALGNKVVVAFNDSGSFLGGLSHFTGYASSSNTGGSFIDHGILPASAVGDAGDPMLARDNATGAFYLTTLGFNSDDVVQFFKSTDGGQTFGPPISIPAGASSSDSRNKEWLTVDNFAGAGQHDIYSCDTNFGGPERIEFFRSIDQGVSFGPPIVVSAAGGQGCNVVVGPDHSVDVFYYRGTGGGGQEGDNKLFVRRSVDLGLTFGPEHQVADLNTNSANGDLALKGGFRSNSFPQAAVNPISGDLVVTYNDDPNLGSPDNGDVFYVKSTDDGVTWSSPVRINEVAANDQFSPTAAITPNGQSIMFGWYDRSEDANNLWFHRRGRAGTMNTTSGAITLRRSFQLSPNTPVAIGQDPVVNATYMGDYDQIDATNAFFHTTWADNRDPSAAHSHQPDVRYAQIATAVANSELAVHVTPSPATIDVGQSTTLTVSVSASNGVARDVFVDLSPVTGLKFQSVPASCRLDGQFIGCSLGNMDAGTSRSLSIGALGVSAGPRTVRATATTSSNDTNQVNNTGTGTVTVSNVPTTTSTFSTGNIAVPINDNSTVDVPISVPNIGAVYKVQVLVRLNHTFDAHLDMFVIDPSTHVVELSTDNGGSGENYGSGANDCSGTPTTFTDTAATPITAGTAPFAGAFSPEQPLSGLFGDPSGGTWKLRVIDDTASNVGTIGCFTLKITHP